MAKRFMEDGRTLEGLSKQEDSSPEFGFDLPARDFNHGSEENMANRGAKKRGWGESRSTDTDKADEELPAEGGPVVNRRPRGRPLGSRNKPKAPVRGIREITDMARSRILEIPSGVNITDFLESFMLSSDVGVVVMGGTGNVTNVNLREPVAVGGMVDNRAPFEIISLTGAFPCGVDTQGGTGLRVTLTDAQGNHVAGTAVSLIAYGTVTLNVATVVNINREVLNVQYPGHLLSPPAVPSQQHFQSPTMMTQIGIQSPSPTLMTVQQQIGMLPMNNAVPKLGIGSVRHHANELMNNVTPHLSIGSARPNYPELMSNVMPNVALTPNSEEPSNNVMSNLAIGSVTPNSHGMISPQPQRSWF